MCIQKRRKASVNNIASRAAFFTVLLLSFSGCKDDEGVGLSIQPDEDLLNTFSGKINVQTERYRVDSVLSKAEHLYLGQYSDINFGITRAEFLTQIDGRAGGVTLPDTSIASSSNDNGVYAGVLTAIDSKYGDITSIYSPSDVKLDSAIFYMKYDNSFLGDSTAIQSVSLYDLKATLPSANKAYSNTDPSLYYDPSKLLGSTTYAVQKSRIIRVKLPDDYAERLFDACTKGTITTQEDFIKEFPGVYVKHSFNEGAVIRITTAGMQVYYSYDANIKTTYDNRDTVLKGSEITHNGKAINPLVSSFIITANKSVEQVNIFSHPDFDEKLATTLSDKAFDYCYSPSGMYTKVDVPFDDVMTKVKGKTKDTSKVVFNSARLCIKGKYIDWETKYAKKPNTYMLLINKDKVVDFFFNNLAPDSETSFVASYDTTKAVYAFDVTRAAQKRMNGNTDILKDMLLVPVYATSVSSSYYFKQSLSPTATITYSSSADSLCPYLDFAFTERK